MLHFEINEAVPYCQYNIDHCFKPHRHTFYQVIWFKSSGKHYVDYQVLYHNKDTILFIDKNQLHSTYFIKVFKKFYKMTPKAFRDTIV